MTIEMRNATLPEFLDDLGSVQLVKYLNSDNIFAYFLSLALP